MVITTVDEKNGDGNVQGCSYGELLVEDHTDGLGALSQCLDLTSGIILE